MKKNGYTDDGIYTIFIGKRLTESLAYCKQQLHGGGWQVIQQRLYQGKNSQKFTVTEITGFQDELSPSESVLKTLISQETFQFEKTLKEPYTKPLMREYVRGFGRADGDYWIGLDKMAMITTIPHELLVQIRDRYGHIMEIQYSFIRINPAEFG